MTKKKRNSRSRRKAAAQRRTPVVRDVPAKTAPAGTKAEAAPRRVDYTRGKTDFAQEYRYVFQDLKRLAILAASIFVVLIALSFVLR